jgi:hypothetical protein
MGTWRDIDSHCGNTVKQQNATLESVLPLLESDFSPRRVSIKLAGGKGGTSGWLEDWEKEAIKTFAREHPLEGYRRLSFMMLDDHVVAVSPTSTYRVFKEADLLSAWNHKPFKEKNRFCATAFAS